MGVMQEDITKRSFVRNLTELDDTSEHPVGINGKKIAFSQDEEYYNDIMDSHK